MLSVNVQQSAERKEKPENDKRIYLSGRRRRRRRWTTEFEGMQSLSFHYLQLHAIQSHHQQPQQEQHNSESTAPPTTVQVKEIYILEAATLVISD